MTDQHSLQNYASHAYSIFYHICLLHWHFFLLCHSAHISTAPSQQAATQDQALGPSPSQAGRRSRGRWPRMNIETLYGCADVGLGKPKPAGSWTRRGMWSTTRRASTNTSTAKERPGKRWTSCWQETRKMPRCSVPSSLRSLPVRFALRNSRPLKPKGKSGARHASSVEEDLVKEHLNNLDVHKSPWPFGMQPQGAGGTGLCYCEASLHYLWKVVVITGGFWGLEESKHHLCLQEWGSRDLQAPQPHFSLSETVSKCEVEEGDWE